MRTILTLCIAIIFLSNTAAYCDILTFDDIPAGTTLWRTLYDYGHRASFSQDFQAVDHTGSVWGPPRSGSNVAAITQNNLSSQYVVFGYFTADRVDPDHIRLVGGHFSTDTNVMVRITAYHIESQQSTPLGSVIVGGAGESWSNRYVEIGFGSSIEKLVFEGVNSPDDLLGFSIDDMTIVPVPEPSSLAAIGLALLPFGAALARRRKR